MEKNVLATSIAYRVGLQNYLCLKRPEVRAVTALTDNMNNPAIPDDASFFKFSFFLFWNEK